MVSQAEIREVFPVGTKATLYQLGEKLGLDDAQTKALRQPINRMMGWGDVEKTDEVEIGGEKKKCGRRIVYRRVK